MRGNPIEHSKNIFQFFRAKTRAMASVRDGHNEPRNTEMIVATTNFANARA